ncbi:MAG: hypothetical protein AB7S78_09650 [Candidatus Omnitrophota bacterium]
MKRYFITTLSVLLSLLWSVSSAYSQSQVYLYKTYNPRTKKTINEYSLTVDELPGGKKKYTRQFTGKRMEEDEDFVLDGDFQTVEWTSTDEGEKTDYTGTKDGKIITVKGMLKGAPVEETIVLPDDKPFYFTPKFNLTKFVLSGETDMEFWMLRKDQLKEYLMQAHKEGVETININGKDVEAVKIDYSAAGKWSKYYKRIYYYRKSDGLFIRRKSPDGDVTELVSP